MTQLQDLDMPKLNEAILDGWRHLTATDIEFLEMLRDTRGGHFQKVLFVDQRVVVYWDRIKMCDVSLLSVRKPTQLDA